MTPPGPREVRRNFACLVWMGSVFAMGWAEVMVVLQPMLVAFGASNTQIGIVQGTLAATLPGMFLAPWVTRKFRRKKALVFAMDCLYLLPIGIIGVAVWTGAVIGGAAAVGFVVVLMAAGQLAAGFGGLPNQEFFTACIPMRLRGRLAGVSAGLGGLLGMAGAGMAAWILAVLPAPDGYGALLVLAWAICMAADSAVLLAAEPETPVERSPVPYSPAMWRALWDDRPFLRVAALCCVLSPLMGQLPVFAGVFAFRELAFKPEMAAWIAMSASASRMVLSPLAGWITDRWGARRALIFWPAASGAGFAALALLPGTATVLGVSGLAAVAWSGFSGAMNALTCGIPKPEHRAGHFTVLAFGMIAANSVFPLLVGGMFDRVPYRSGFTILAVALLAACAAGLVLVRGLSLRAADYE